MASKYQCKNIASGHTNVNLSSVSLLQWVNDLLGTKIQNVEALRSGSAYCQLLDMLFPGCIPLMKIKYEATQTAEFWINMKYLEKGFRAIGCEKDIPVEELMKGQVQENLEFLQWFKAFYDVNYDESAITPKAETRPQTSLKGPKSRTVFTLIEPMHGQAGVEMDLPLEGLAQQLPPEEPPQQ